MEIVHHNEHRALYDAFRLDRQEIMRNVRLQQIRQKLAQKKAIHKK